MCIAYVYATSLHALTASPSFLASSRTTGHIIFGIFGVHSNNSEIAHTVSERNILAKNVHPFLVSLRFSFQTSEKLYLGLDYIPGGELFVVLQVPPHEYTRVTRMHTRTMTYMHTPLTCRLSG